MSDRGYRPVVSSQSLPIALACTLAASLGGCSTFALNGHGWGWQNGSSEVACRNDSGQSKVFASVQRIETQSRNPDDYSEPVADEGVIVTDEPPAPPAPPPPEAKPPPEEPEPKVAIVPEPPAPPPRPQPPPEVEAVCGATEIACQDQLTAMLADPLHKWIKEKPTAQQDRSGVRVLAYRVLTPVLACDDLRAGLRETEAVVAGIDSGATQPEGNPSGKSLEWVQLLGRAVKLELKSEIEKRC